MPKFTVWHFSGDVMMGREAKQAVGVFLQYPENWSIVCDLWADSPEHAFKLTNHIDKPWTDNPEIRHLRQPNPRSTSVGDVIIEYEPRQAPKIYMVMSAGMQLVPGNFEP